MLRSLLLASLLALVPGVAACGGGAAPAPVAPGNDLPPLPPASGTPIGYLLDNASALALTDPQMAELRRIDTSLAARNDTIDTQLREIEKPEPAEPEDPKAPPKPPPNMAPGQQPLRTTPDAQRLHQARAENNQEALARAFAVLEPAQQDTARKLLAERGIKAPGAGGPAARPAGGDDDGGDDGGEPAPRGEP